MSALQGVVVAMLRTFSGLAPEAWRMIIVVVADSIERASWGPDDKRWKDVAELVTDLMADMTKAQALTGSALITARAAAEVVYTRKLKNMGLLEVV